MDLIDDPKRARRVARHIASDILYYNKELIQEGLKNDNLFEALSELIEEGRENFETRVSPEFHQANLFDSALVDILVRSLGDTPSKLW